MKKEIVGVNIKLLKQIKYGIIKCLPPSAQTFMINRQDKLLWGIDKEQKGLEIGPSHQPVAPKRCGYCVETVDYKSAEELKEHYKNIGVDIKAIEPVDYIWNGGSYYQLIQKEHYYDYIIASHMIEHCVDFCGFLKDCSILLKPDGILRLAVPDKRYCFDHYRMTTGLAEVVDNAETPCRLQSVGNVADYYINVVRRNGIISWNKPFLGSGRKNRGWEVTFVHNKDTVLNEINRVRAGEYIDIHHYVFTPSSFRLLINDLRLLEVTDMKIVHMWETWGNEFIVTLQKTNERLQWNPQYREKLLRIRDKENRV